jgi:hypothetical protein
VASIPFGIEFDRIAPDLPPVLNTAAAAGYDAARRRQTFAFFFERLRSRCIGRLQRLDGDPANGWNRRMGAVDPPFRRQTGVAPIEPAGNGRSTIYT